MEDSIKNLNRLKNIFKEIFDSEDIEITAETTKTDIKDWDSVAQVKLVLSVEEEFDIRLATEEVSSINSVKDFLKAIENKSRK